MLTVGITACYDLGAGMLAEFEMSTRLTLLELEHRTDNKLGQYRICSPV